MKFGYKSPSSVVARSAFFNLLGEGWTFLVLVAAMPRLVKYMGDDGFGLFSLAWVAIAYLLFLDIGVSRATTKFVSEHMAHSEVKEFRIVVRSALVANLVLGCLGGVAVLGTMPLLFGLFKIPAGLHREATLVFWGVALAVPSLLVQGVIRAVLSSMQRFGAINIINGVASTGQWGIAWLLAWKGVGVGWIVLVVVIFRLFSTVAYAIVLLRLEPTLLRGTHFDFDTLKKLLKFGGWVSVSQILSPVLVYFDRAVIASLISLAAVTVYTVPNEITTRLRIIPASVVASLYPALSERASCAPELNRFYSASVRYLLLLLAPMFSLLALFGPDLLVLWMGQTFASKGAVVLQVMIFGAFLNCMAYVPYALLQAVGRPDLTGKLHLLEAPFYVGLCLLLIPRFGIVGAAIAGTVRYAVDAILLFYCAQRKDARSIFDGELLRASGLALLFATTALLIHFLTMSILFRCVSSGVLIAIYALVAWRLCISLADRPAIVRVVGLGRQRIAEG